MDTTASRFSSTIQHALGAQQGDEISWSRLERKVRPWIDAEVAGKRMPPDCDVDDVAQLVLIEMFSRLAEFEIRSRETFQSWVTLIARHKVFDLWRRARAKSRGEGKAVPLQIDSEVQVQPVSPGPSPSSIAGRVELEARLAAALASLSEKDRQIILLRDQVGLTCAEIAREVTYEKEDTVRRRLGRARKKFQEVLGKIADEFLMESRRQSGSPGPASPDRPRPQ